MMDRIYITAMRGGRTFTLVQAMKEALRSGKKIKIIGGMRGNSIKCADCGKWFKAGKRPDGLPNGVGYRLADGSVYNVCTECIIKRGERNEESNNHIKP